MSVVKQYGGKLPEDAVILSYEEAFAQQLELIREWEKPREVWPLKYGVSILGIAASLTGIYINGHYRKKLRLTKLGFMSTYLPIVVLPGMISAVVHKLFVTENIIMETSKCPLCLQTKAMLLQTSVGFIYPLILSPLGNSMHAVRHATYRLPILTSDFFGAAKTLVKFAQPIGTQLSVMCVGQALLASYFTYIEAKSYYNVKQRMMQIEREYEDSRTDLDAAK